MYFLCISKITLYRVYCISSEKKLKKKTSKIKNVFFPRSIQAGAEEGGGAAAYVGAITLAEGSSG
jgi:hypothetical protein